jgi:hypothetical protein
MVYDRSLYRKIVHPLQWTRFAMKIEGLSIEQQPQDKPLKQEGEKK